MISLKRALAVAVVSATVLLGGAAAAHACPGDELPAGQVAAAMPDGSGSTPPAEQDTEAPLSPACTAALVTASNDHGARFSSVAAQVASACAEDSATVGTVINYVTAH